MLVFSTVTKVCVTNFTVPVRLIVTMTKIPDLGEMFRFIVVRMAQWGRELPPWWSGSGEKRRDRDEGDSSKGHCQ